MIPNIFHAIPHWGQAIVIRIDVHACGGTIHTSTQPVQLPVQILLPAELAVHNDGQTSFWLTGFNQSIPPAILAWLQHRSTEALERHPHYSAYLSQEVSHAP